MHVVFTLPSLARQFGGPAAKTPGLGEALRRLGHQVVLLGVGDAPDEHSIGLKPVGRFHSTPIPLAFHRIAATVKRADIVHIVGYRDPVGTVAALAARACRVPFVLEPEGMRRARGRSKMLKAAFDATLGPLVLGGARLVSATSAREARELVEDGVARSRVAIRPNGLDLASLEPLPPRGGFRARIGLPDDAPLLLWIGRLAVAKGLSFLVDATSRVLGAHLVLAGPDEHDGTLQSVVETRDRVGLNGRVHVLQQGLWGAEKLQALVDADVFCLVSMTETFGLVAAEAAACRTATIVSDQCGVAEWLRDGLEVVPYGDVPRLGATIERLLRNPQERHALGERGRVAARALSWETIAKQQVGLYEQVLHS